MNDPAPPDAAPEARSRIDLPIEGMTCAACAVRIEKNLNRLPGVNAAVNFATERASVLFDPARAASTDLVEAVKRAGYGVPAQTVELALEGMTCAACAVRIENSLNRLPGVEAAVNFATERARVRLEPGGATPQDLLAAVKRTGYDAHEVTEASREAEKARHA